MKYQMLHTMRWFGPQDKISLRDIRQCDVKGIVTALHHIPVGDIWTVDEIKRRQQEIRDEGMEWTVVESLPVSEDIKRQKGDFKIHIDNYKTSLKNLATCGIYVVTYNFMPILDWIRTNHAYVNADGTRALLYDHKAFIYFDVFLLKRPGSTESYSEEEIEVALQYGQNLTDSEKEQLFRNVLLGLPGSTENFTAKEILALLDNYKDIDDSSLRDHLIYFLKEVVPVAEDLGIKLAIHPDDPPFSVMGLPRVVSQTSDLQQIFDAVPSVANGLCFCTGSLGAHPDNDLMKIIKLFGKRIHFLHLRNVKRENKDVFRESAHLDGDVQMKSVMTEILKLMEKRKVSLPMRPDHGFLFSIEGQKEQYPGYSLIGRMKGLAELRGLEMGISN